MARRNCDAAADQLPSLAQWRRVRSPGTHSHFSCRPVFAISAVRQSIRREHRKAQI